MLGATPQTMMQGGCGSALAGRPKQAYHERGGSEGDVDDGAEGGGHQQVPAWQILQPLSQGKLDDGQVSWVWHIKLNRRGGGRRGASAAQLSVCLLHP